MIAVERSKFPGEGPIPGFLETKEEVMLVLNDHFECSYCEDFPNEEKCQVADGKRCIEFGITKAECYEARKVIANAMKSIDDGKIFFWMSSTSDSMQSSIKGETIIDEYQPC
jgi:hypothetical protein